ncbi:hypothetical protein [Thermomonospora curvata]|uniref:DUF3291 domain-containing protein n=1 Tax=Thermomonospora curvata (strain ATCC 19995 / DSM 43183 / JCM 3096 / KCTC 9072 / NBRC 15933 / NCIMB 10081 / Henssen B9) TaxID=471852 RepID=D1AB60_THECD|nr:hypothetical protein [Thermomonospora curvata]ACY99003.1 conserved hypothetical protein [Thermomonospora curvata DSM 43183]
MEIPWSSTGHRETGATALVMASRFQLKTPWRAPAFLLHSLRLWRQARRAPGALGVSLRARPLRGTFWTLSAWTDHEALYRYARTDPHGAVMRKIRPWTRDAQFRFWELPVIDLPRDRNAAAALWEEADRHLALPFSPRRAA